MHLSRSHRDMLCPHGEFPAERSQQNPRAAFLPSPPAGAQEEREGFLIPAWKLFLWSPLAPSFSTTPLAARSC